MQPLSSSVVIGTKMGHCKGTAKNGKNHLAECPLYLGIFAQSGMGVIFPF